MGGKEFKQNSCNKTDLTTSQHDQVHERHAIISGHGKKRAVPETIHLKSTYIAMCTLMQFFDS